MVKAKFSDIAKNRNLIFSPNFFKWNLELEANSWFLSERIADNFTILSGYAFKSSDYVDEGVAILRIGNIKKDGSIDFDGMNKLPNDFKEQHKNYLILKNDIVIAMTGATIGKSGLVSNLPYPTLLNQRVGIIRKKENAKVTVKFIQYLLRSLFFQKQVYINSMGKSQPNISPFDILNLKLPKIDNKTQSELIKKIVPIEKEVNTLQEQKKEPLEIINEVFSDYYGYSKKLWKEFGKGMTAGTQKSNTKTFKTYSVSFSKIKNSKTLRFSSRFHNPITQKLTDILFSKPVIKVEKILSEIVKGIQPKYSNNGDVTVIKIANLKNGYIDFEDTELVKQSFYENLTNKQKVHKNDILLCCTGKVSLGKIDIYEIYDDAVLSVDSYIIRVDDNKYNRLFFVYFFRSILGSYQIERDYTGATNQIHLYDKQIKDFDIPNIPLKEQEKLVSEITKKLNAQKEIDKKIEEKQNKISELIENTIKENDKANA